MTDVAAPERTDPDAPRIFQTGPARRRPAARADRRAHAARTCPRRTTGTGATSSSTSGSRERVGGLRVVDMACGEGYGTEVLARTRRARSSASTRTPRRTSTRGALHARRDVRFERTLIDTLRRAVRRGRLPADDRARHEPGRDPRALRAVVAGPRGVVYVSTPNVLTLAPEGAERSGNPWHVHEYRAAGVPRAVRGALRRGRAARPLPRPQAARPPGRDRAAGLGRGPRAAAASRSRSTTASRRRSRRATSRCARDATSTARSTSSRSAARERARAASRSSSTPTCPTSRASGRGRSARSGCGRRSRRATCRCSACSTTGAPLTLSLTPVLCDQLAAPGALERCAAFLRDVRPASHALDVDGLPRGRRGRRSPPSSSAPPGSTRDALAQLERSAATCSRALAPHAAWTSSATHAILPLLATDAGVRLQLADRDRRSHRARFGELARRPLAAGVRARAVARPAARGGRRARDVRRADRRLRPRRRAPPRAAAQRRRAAARADRPRADRPRLGPGGYPSRARLPRRAPPHRARPQAVGQRRRDLRPRRGRSRRRAPTPPSFAERCARARRRRRALHAARSTPSCSATTGTRARRSSRAFVAGLRRARRRARRARRRARGRRHRSRGPTALDAATTLGPAADALDLVRPAGRATSRSRPARRRAARRSPRGADVPRARALRELLALQASDWAFLVTRALAGPYALERIEGHRAALDGRARLGTLRGPRAAQPRAASSAPPHCSSREPRPHPLLGVPADRRGRAGAACAQALRGARRARASRSTSSRAATRRCRAEEVVGGVTVHRVREPRRPRDLGEFVAWIEHMNADMLAAGVELGDALDFDLVHGHDWLVAVAGDHLAKRFRCPFVVDDPRDRVRPPPGLGRQAPAEPHPRHRALDGAPRRARHHLLALHARPRLRHLRPRRGPGRGDPERDRPDGPAAGRRPRDAARALRRARTRSSSLLVGRLVYEKGFQLALEALEPIIRDGEVPGGVRFLVAGSGTHEEELKEQAARARPARARHVPRLDRRRRPALALPDRRPLRGARASTSRSASSRSRRWPAAARASSPTPAACARSCPTGERVGLRFNGGDAEHLGVMIERLLTDDELRDRLVLEAGEHVLRFDWADVARQTGRALRRGHLAARPPSLTARTAVDARADAHSAQPSLAGNSGRTERRSVGWREALTRTPIAPGRARASAVAGVGASPKRGMLP